MPKSREQIENEILHEAISAESEGKKPAAPYVIKIISFLLAVLIIGLIIPGYIINVYNNPEIIPGKEIIQTVFTEDDFLNLNITHGNDFQNIYTKFIVPYDPKVKRLADKIVSESCPESGEICSAKAIFYFVRDNIDYIKDPVMYEYIKHPYETLATLNGDCDDMAVLTSNLMQAVGIRTELVTIPNHMFLKVSLPKFFNIGELDRKWVYLDPTCKDCGFGEIPESNRQQIKD